MQSIIKIKIKKNSNQCIIQSLHTEVCMQSIPRTKRPNTEAPLSSSNSPASCPSTLSLITSWILNLSWGFLSFNVITFTCNIKTRSDITQSSSYCLWVTLPIGVDTTRNIMLQLIVMNIAILYCSY